MSHRGRSDAIRRHGFTEYSRLNHAAYPVCFETSPSGLLASGIGALEFVKSASNNALVLIVEDFIHAREMYADYLTHVGFRVVEVMNGIEAVEMARKCQPDIILMDLALPKMDGWEATRRLKKSARTKHIPILALTGHALEGFEKTALAVGCDAFLRKPCLPDELLAALRKHLKLSSNGTSKARNRAVAKPKSVRTQKHRGKAGRDERAKP